MMQVTAVIDFIEKTEKEFRKSPYAPTFARHREHIRISIMDFMETSGSRLMSGTFESNGVDMLTCTDLIQSIFTSPAELREKARSVPLHGAFYDLLFHNCQLFLLQLICQRYLVPLKVMPLAVGSVVASPLLLVMELTFLALFQALQTTQTTDVAAVFGVAWICAEAYLAYRYPRENRLDYLPGIAALLITVLLLIYLRRQGTDLVTAIPVLSLLWDMVMILESMRVNMVHQSRPLTWLNAGLFILAVGLVARVQFLNGWPVQDLLIVVLLAPLLLCDCSCGN